ncbi:Uncharacterised protein [Mycobacteroides abscessus subsp. abscessus]|nr:Uncharacterised protein [Mycobacteroides abscessus subsp. abscessus]
MYVRLIAMICRMKPDQEPCQCAPVFGHPTGGAEMLKKQRGHQQAELACLCRGA